LTNELIPEKTTRRWLSAALWLVVLTALTYLLWLALPAPARAYLLGAVSSVEGMEAAIADAGVLGPLVSIALMVLHSLIPFPAEMLAVANGMLFGLALGFLLTWAGAMLGALLAYWVARRFGQELVQRLLGERRWKKLDSFMHSFGARSLILVRLTPVVSFNLVNYAAGLAGVPLWTFLWTTAIGILPITVASVLVGSHMISAPWTLWIALIAVVGLLMYAHWRMSRR
jgi:uncharacterized membrane protein YdjX (TVP38/TMEM64 family)